MSDMHLSDVTTLRERARKNVENGAVTESYSADREEVLRLLNESLATELVCVLRYKRHYFMANGLKAHVAADEFLEHATQEAQHADRLAERIVQLGGEPEFNPDLLSKNSHAHTWPATRSRKWSTKTWSPSASPSTATARSFSTLASKTLPPGASSKTSWLRKKSMRMTWPIF